MSEYNEHGIQPEHQTISSVRSREELPRTGMSRLSAALCTAAFAGSLLSCNSSESRMPHPSVEGVFHVVTLDHPTATISPLTGKGTVMCDQYQTCGADVGLVYQSTSTGVPDNTIHIIFGDSFKDTPDHARLWRSNTGGILTVPTSLGERARVSDVIGDTSKGIAPSLLKKEPGEVTIIPTGAAQLPDGRHVMAAQSITEWQHPHWKTRYSTLAFSDDEGQTFRRSHLRWENQDGQSPYQMMSLAVDGGYLYMVSTRAGRTKGPVHLTRVATKQVEDLSAYECWNGSEGGWDSTECAPIIPESDRYIVSEPSITKLADGYWALAYLDHRSGQIVTRTAQNIWGPWSDPKVQITASDVPNLYAGQVMPGSTQDAAAMTLSTWQKNEKGRTTAYGVLYADGLTLMDEH